MHRIPTHSYALIALSLIMGFGLALAATSLAFAQKDQAAQAPQIPAAYAEQAPRQAESSPASPTPSQRLYVSKSGDGTNGITWTSAFTRVQDALDIAISGQEIWVASGVYTPGLTISDSFALVPGAALYGGFAGGETVLGQRDWTANPTVLSGDIGGDDMTDANGVVTNTGDIVGDNSYHVVYADGASGIPITGTTVLDGFSITGGQADGSAPDYRGGGFYCDGSGSGAVCSPSLRNMAFSGNYAINLAGAMYNDGSSSGNSSPSLVDVTFSGNSAVNGGAMHNFGASGASSPSLVDVTFSGNSATGNGGAMVNIGSGSGVSSPSLLNVAFSGNSASSGGAMYNGGLFGISSPRLVNVILWNDTATTSGDEIYNSYASLVITTSLVQGGITGTGIFNSSSSVTDGGGNIDGNPLFVRDPDPGDGSWTTLADNDYGDLRLRVGSPAIDAGTNLPELPPTDLGGNPRIINGVVDMGAFEAFLEIYLPLIMK